jgi:hypothetical protein
VARLRASAQLATVRRLHRHGAGFRRSDRRQRGAYDLHRRQSLSGAAAAGPATLPGMVPRQPCLRSRRRQDPGRHLAAAHGRAHVDRGRHLLGQCRPADRPRQAGFPRPGDGRRGAVAPAPRRRRCRRPGADFCAHAGNGIAGVEGTDRASTISNSSRNGSTGSSLPAPASRARASNIAKPRRRCSASRRRRSCSPTKSCRLAGGSASSTETCPTL